LVRERRQSAELTDPPSTSYRAPVLTDADFPGTVYDMTMPDGTATDTALGGYESGGVEGMPGPGQLHIKQRVSWKTWHVVLVALVMFLIGAAVNYKAVGASTETSNKPAYTLPGSSGTATTTTSPSSSPAGGSSSTTTTAAGAGGGTPTTTAASGSSTTTSSTPASGPARVLLGPTQLQGNWTSPAFTTTVASWNIGWAFKCSPAPASGASFVVYVTPAGGKPSGTPAISETGPSGQAVTAQTGVGAQTLAVQSPPGCTWVVKVTGS
jgi:hypothetical protein